MAYLIKYSTDSSVLYPKKHSGRFRWKTVTVLIALFISALYIKISGFPDCLIPGDKATTKRAAQTMLYDISAGERLENAVTTFCREIIQSATE